MRHLILKSFKITFSMCIILVGYNNLVASEIKIKQILLNNNVYDYSMSPFYIDIKYTKLDMDAIPIDLVILFPVKTISFKFTINDHKSLIYKNKLEGLNNNWTFCDTNRISTFSNLKQGKYTYRIQGLKQNKIICEKVFSFEVSFNNKEEIVTDILFLIIATAIIYFTIKMK